MSLSKGSKRLARILKLIPFLQRNSGINLEDTAKFFEISAEQLIADLNLIWMCGLPGYSHLELMDVSYDSGFITIQNAETLNRPMRMTFDEGAALLLAIENLAAIAPAADLQVIATLRKKIAQLLSIEIDHPTVPVIGNPGIMVELLRALEQKDVALEIDYYSATLDETIRRTISPQEILTMNGFGYLAGYVHEEGRKLFCRLDRILSVTSQPSAHAIVQVSNPPAAEKPASLVDVRIAERGYWFIQKWRLRGLTYDSQAGEYFGAIEVFNPTWLVRAAMSAGGALEVLAPQDLRLKVSQGAQRTLERYENAVK